MLKLRLVTIGIVVVWIVSYFFVQFFEPNKAVFSASLNCFLVGIALLLSTSSHPNNWFPDFNWTRLALVIVVLLLGRLSFANGWRVDAWSLPPVFGLALAGEGIVCRIRKAVGPRS